MKEEIFAQMKKLERSLNRFERGWRRTANAARGLVSKTGAVRVEVKGKPAIRAEIVKTSKKASQLDSRLFNENMQKLHLSLMNTCPRDTQTLRSAWRIKPTVRERKTKRATIRVEPIPYQYFGGLPGTVQRSESAPIIPRTAVESAIATELGLAPARAIPRIWIDRRSRFWGSTAAKSFFVNVSPSKKAGYITRAWNEMLQKVNAQLKEFAST